MRWPKLKTRNELIFLGLTLPSIVGLLAFFLVPFVYSLYLAMLDNQIGRNFVGIHHFRVTVNNAAFRLAMRNTLVFMALCVPINIVVPLMVAMGLNKTAFKKAFMLFFMLPLVVPSGSLVFFWRAVFGLGGALNGMFYTNQPVNWLNNDSAMLVILVIFMWKNAGFNIVLYLAGLNLIPKDYYEVAAIEGAGRWRQFWGITVVYLSPTFFMVLLMSILATFRSFREIYLLAGAYPHPSIYMLQHYMNNMFASLNYQRLAAAAYILAAGIIAVMALVFWLQRRVGGYDG